MKFYDTCSLLLRVNNLFDEGKFLVSSITLNELENIKTSANKDPDVKFAARRLLHQLDENTDKFEVCVFTTDMLDPIESFHLSVTEDAKILACALYAREKDENLIFVTNDLCLKSIARIFFDSDFITSVNEDVVDDYSGYAEIHMTDDLMTKFYSNPTENIFNLNINEYINVYNNDNELVDTLVWTGEGYRHLSYRPFTSAWFGEIKPAKGDIYQAMAADSFLNNKITMIKGPAGSGKTYLALAFLVAQLEHGNIDKIIVFCNTVATKGSAKLGFYPGTRDEKLLDSQIGNLLASKFGGKCEVERMVQEEKLILLPLSDIRGYDTSGMNAGIYISEAQNLDIDLMKLALQRIGEDSICIVDGDEKTQVDDINFAGMNNGMRRMSKIFRGEDIYGEVELKSIHRSRIAEIAQKM